MIIDIIIVQYYKYHKKISRIHSTKFKQNQIILFKFYQNLKILNFRT
jgi:hypothetical protein